MNSMYRDLGCYVDEAIDYLIYNGWSNHETDLMLAEFRYDEWIKETQGSWFEHRWRDRELLFQNIQLDMRISHDEAAGPCYAILLMLMLEIRANDDDPDGCGLLIFRPRVSDGTRCQDEVPDAS